MSIEEKGWHGPYAVMLLFYSLFISYAFFLDSPRDLFEGLSLIVKSRDLLITDYIELAGFGAALVNVSLVGIACIFLMLLAKAKPNGAIIMALWLTTGFSFFGKNIANIWPVMFGVYLFSCYQRRPFASYALVCLLSTSLAPLVSQTTYLEVFNYSEVAGIITGSIVGVVAGFLLPSLSVYCIRVHSGYNLYNVGFAAGLIGMVYTSFAQTVGINIAPVFIWGVHYNLTISIFVYCVSLGLIGIGLLCGGRISVKRLRRLFSHSGRLVTDYYMIYDESVYINMGILGIFSCTLMLLIGADLNGPTLGGIFTIMGFGAFGKHLLNVTPIMIGAILSSFFNTMDLTSASNTLAILFSTCLAPIAGQFGWGWGIVAGFMHVSFIPGMGSLHSGLNLYNNGFGAGFVVMILLPIITAVKKREDDAL